MLLLADLTYVLSCPRLTPMITLVYTLFGLFPSDKHVPVDHSVRSLTLSDLRNVHLFGHGLEQRGHRTTEHDRICVAEVQGGGYTSVSPVHEINCVPLKHSCRELRFVI